MNLYKILLFVHVAAAAVWVGGGFMLHLISTRTVASNDPGPSRRAAHRCRASWGSASSVLLRVSPSSPASGWSSRELGLDGTIRDRRPRRDRRCRCSSASRWSNRPRPRPDKLLHPAERSPPRCPAGSSAGSEVLADRPRDTHDRPLPDDGEAGLTAVSFAAKVSHVTTVV